jgi:predicted transcriptional regulator
MAQKYAFVMMTKQKWWNRFVSDHRDGKLIQSYVQKGKAPPKTASIILFYVTKPVAQIAGCAEFIERTVGKPIDLWGKHGKESVLKSEKEYEELVGDQPHVSFIRFQNLQEAVHAIPLADILSLLGTRRLSRKGFYVDKETADKAVALLQ